MTRIDLGRFSPSLCSGCYASLAGYSSVDEFINHALEKEITKLEGADSEEEIKKRLKGLGYIS